ncbi:MAG: hypothetical protein K6F52_05120 [Clostridia bacterium]|nr:hypothetical protein [Clostridia bacterium]
MIFGFGVYLTIQANIGVAPWDAFALGLSSTFGILYGTASIIVSFTVIALDLIMREQIGIGTILDAIVVGKTVDLLNWLGLVPKSESLWFSLLLFLVGFLIMGFSQFLYMKSGLSCGPRDAMLVGLNRRINKIPIGALNTCILAVVLVIGWFLGGPVGIGSIIAPFGIGLMQQLAFNILKFEPRKVKHQNIISSCRVILGINKSGK